MKRAMLSLGLVVLAACSAGEEGGPRSDRYVVAVDVAVPEGIGDWAPNSTGSRLCTHGSRDSITFTASDGEASALVETFGSEPVSSAPLGASSGEIVSGACTNLLVLDVAALENVTVTATSADGTRLGEFSTSAIETELDSGLAGRRSPGSPWRLRP